MEHSFLKLMLCSSAFVSSLAVASPIEIADMTVAWVKVTSNAPVVSGQKTDAIYWINSAPEHQSGYSFTDSAAPVLNISEGKETSLTESAHLLESVYHFDHLQAANAAARNQSCANEEFSEPRINHYGCADLVKLPWNRTSSTYYSFGSKRYYVSANVFFQNGELAHAVWPQERTSSTSLLVGIIRSSALKVPEPSSVVLVMLSLLGLFSRKVWRRA